MNKYNAETFKKIKRAAENYQTDVTTAYSLYRQRAENAKAYKDEEGQITAAKEAARESINRAENVFTRAVKEELDDLRDELNRHLTTAPNSKYLEALNVYNAYGITPGKTEVAALMQQAGGNTLSLCALNAVLDKTHSAYRVSAPNAEDFERDLDILGQLAEGHIMWSPKGYHLEAVDVWSGITRQARNENGQYFNTGVAWDSVGILTHSTAFESSINKLDEMAERWTDSVLPTIYDSERYQTSKDPDTGETITGEQQFIEDYKKTASAGKIEHNPEYETALARAEGEADAARAARAQEVVNYFSR